jgi:hypothetical protein
MLVLQKVQFERRVCRMNEIMNVGAKERLW